MAGSLGPGRELLGALVLLVGTARVVLVVARVAREHETVLVAAVDERPEVALAVADVVAMRLDWKASSASRRTSIGYLANVLTTVCATGQVMESVDVVGQKLTTLILYTCPLAGLLGKAP